MKNLFQNIVKLFTLSLVMVLVSCGDDEEVIVETPSAPTITMVSDQLNSASTYEATAGDSIIFSINVDAPGGFNTYNVKAFADNAEVTITPAIAESKASGTTVLSFVSDQTNTVTFGEEFVGTAIEFVVTAVDDLNQTTEASYSMTVVSIPVNVYTAVLLAAPLADDANTSADERTSETWYSTNLGATITSADIVSDAASSANVDFGYAYITEANLGSPASYPSSVYDLSSGGQSWGTLNDTKFRKTTITSEMFSGLDTFSEIEDAFDNGTDETGLMEGLEKDQVIAFQTDATKDGGAKKGIIIVRDIVTGFDANGQITIEVVVQK